MTAKKELRLIVRIANKDLDGAKPVPMALQKIKGIGQRMGHLIAHAFEVETGFDMSRKLGEIDETQDAKLEEILANPAKHGIPAWALNRRNDYESGNDKHIVLSDLDFGLRKDLQRLNEIKSYRGLRHSWGLTVRGQRTKSTHRGKGGVVGVFKKDSGKPVAPAAAPGAGAKAAAPEAKGKK